MNIIIYFPIVIILYIIYYAILERRLLCMISTVASGSITEVNRNILKAELLLSFCSLVYLLYAIITSASVNDLCTSNKLS